MTHKDDNTTLRNGYGIEIRPGRSYYLLSGDGETVNPIKYRVVGFQEDKARLEDKDGFGFLAKLDDLKQHLTTEPSKKTEAPVPKKETYVFAKDIPTVTPRPKPLPGTVADMLMSFTTKNPELSPIDDINEQFTPADMIRFVNFCDTLRGLRPVDPLTCKHLNLIDDEDGKECLDCGVKSSK